MDLKHLQDFVSLCGTRSFSRSAAARNVTQSAFSRRIQALERWLGASVVDRSTYPTTLTAEGQAFREVAEEVLRMLEDAQADTRNRRGSSRRTIRFSALHTLALSFFPAWLNEIANRLEPFNTDVLADNAHNCVQALVEGDSDFLLTFHHDAVPVSIDPERFAYTIIGKDRLFAASAARDGEPLFQLENETALLAYGRDSFLGRLSHHVAEVQAVDMRPRHINGNAVAEALKAMVVAGHGVAWLPESLVRRELATGSIADLGRAETMEIRLYRSAGKVRALVESIWEIAQAQANPAKE